MKSYYKKRLTVVVSTALLGAVSAAIYQRVYLQYTWLESLPIAIGFLCGWSIAGLAHTALREKKAQSHNQRRDN
jgi:Na+-transporting NADH:ubiquinone oxidoreductase subunit NqrE